MAGNLAPFLFPQYFDASGNPLAGGKIYSYQSGTSTPQATYTSSSLGTPNANPVVLDANGCAEIWLDPTLSYKFILKDSSDVQVADVDNVIGTLTADAVATASIQDLAVTTAKLADDSVTAAKLKDSASVDADRAVTSDHIRDSAITSGKIPASTIGVNALNLSLSASVAANALTIAVKDASGANASATSPVKIGFRDSTASAGTPVARSITAALSVVVSSGSTLGHASAQNQYVYVYAIDNAGTVELAVSGQPVVDEGGVVSTTAEGGAGGADSGVTLYSTVARTNVPIRLIGRLKSSQTVAGTWSAAISEISLAPFENRRPRAMVRVKIGNGFGSTNTKIRRFTTNVETVGSAITYADSAADGASFTIAEDGVYSFHYSDQHSTAAASLGVTRNSTELTTNVNAVTEADLLVWANTPAAAITGMVSTSAYCRAGDVIRPHTDGISDAASNSVSFTACQMSR